MYNESERLLKLPGDVISFFATSKSQVILNNQKLTTMGWK